jgi:hypothetical protein
MIRAIAILSLVLAPAAQAGQQSPGSAPEDADARCLGALSLMAASDDKASQDIGKVGTVFFTGKLRGRNPAVDLETVLRRVYPALETSLASENKRCLAELQAAGTAMVTAGNALQKKPD